MREESFYSYDIVRVIFLALAQHCRANKKLSILVAMSILSALVTLTTPLPKRVYEVRADKDAQFYFDVKINSTTVHMTFDTGADNISLAPHDAEALGFNLDELNYNIPVRTSNGRTWLARVTLSKLNIGGIEIYDVPARVGLGGLDQSLIGASILKYVDVEMTERRLKLRQKS